MAILAFAVIIFAVLWFCFRSKSPRIVRIEFLVWEQNSMVNLSVKAVWSDSFRGFDDTHPAPDGWDVQFASDTGTVTKTGSDAATFESTSAAVVTATEGSFTATYDFVPAAPTITGIEIEAS